MSYSKDSRLKQTVVVMILAIAIFAAPGVSSQDDEPEGSPTSQDPGQTNVSQPSSTNALGELTLCLGSTSDLVDLDGDLLSDSVEACFLGTSPNIDDTDDDGINDGLDATPLAKGAEVPLDIAIVSIQEIHVGTGCDENGLWDPYLQAFAYNIPTLNEDIGLSFAGLTAGTHAHDRSIIISPGELIGTKTSGTGSVSGGKVTFMLSPDLTTWNGGLNDLGLKLRFTGQMNDHDHHWSGNDDFMPFSNPSFGILTLSVPSFALNSLHAHDADSIHIHCQTQVNLETVFTGLTEQILDTADAKLGTTGLIKCSHPQMNGCALNQNWHGAPR